MKPVDLLALVCLATTIDELVMAGHSNLQEWAQYKRQHGKVHETPEENVRRFSLFLASKERIHEHNANEQASYQLGLNHMSDWSQDELVRLNGFRCDSIEHDKLLELSNDNDPFLQQILADPSPVTAKLDWRKIPNRVTGVKKQGRCSSDWAFAATGVLEGQQVVRNFSQELIALSEQNLVDCSRENWACFCGSTAWALDDIAKIGGIESEKDYPYNADEGVCAFRKKGAVMTDLGSVLLHKKHDDAIKEVLAKYGPIAVIVDTSKDFLQYKSGIFNNNDCGVNVNHELLLIGYDTDPKEGDYWILKNEWSTDWGEEGYMRIKCGLCGIGIMSTIAKFE